jgi:hypothetical protein
MAEKPEKMWTLQDHDHEWMVWEKRDPKFIDKTTDPVKAMTLVTEDMARRYAVCPSCGTRMSVGTT